MKLKLFISIILLYTVAFHAQQLPNRYVDEITTKLNVDTNITFSNNIPTVKTTNLFGNHFANENTYGERKITLKMDIYRPSNDALNKRPVIIFAFGGGFVNGERTEKSMIQLCESFARRGFVTATIDYRKGMHVGDAELAKRAVYRALQDGRSAVRFFRKNARAYGVDPNQIYISGHSAGALLAYHVAYLDKDSERPTSTRNFFGRADLGGLDAIGDNKTYSNGAPVSGKANGAMGFAGAVGDLSYIESSNEVPGVYFHSSDDNTVPYNSDEPFSNLNWIPGINLPIVYGSNLMNKKANSTNALHKFYSYNNRGHNVHSNGSNIYQDVIANGAKYFYENLLKPSLTTISGEANICTTCKSQTYTATNNAHYYDWKITGGNFVSKDPHSNTVTVKWNINASQRNLTVTPYSEQLARGKSDNLYPNLNDCDWKITTGEATDIGSGKQNTFIIGTNKKVYQWNNNGWTRLADIDAKQVDVQDGIPWVIGTDNRIYRYINNRWEKMRGTAWYIGASGSHIYHIGRSNSIYKYRGDNRWDQIKGKKVKRVDAAPNGDAWAIGTDDHIYQYQNNGWTGKKGNFRASDITFVDGTNNVWAIELGTGVPHKYAGNGIWERFSGILTSISGLNGKLWGTNSSNKIYNNKCFGSSSRKTVIKKDNDELATFTINIYPNPTTDILNIKLNNFTENKVKASLTNLSGQIVYAVTLDNTEEGIKEINVSELAKGIYILNIETSEKLITRKKIVIK